MKPNDAVFFVKCRSVEGLRQSDKHERQAAFQVLHKAAMRAARKGSKALAKTRRAQAQRIWDSFS